MIACSAPDSTQLSQVHARTVDPPWAIEPFELTDQTGAPFTLASLAGRWTVLFSGFTSCPDICPATLGILKAAQENLAPRHDLQTVFVTVDPDRDTPASLAEYLDWFDERWIGVTGDPFELDQLLESLQMAYVRVPTGNNEYTMDHATAVALIGPDGKMRAFWTAPLDVDQVAADLAALPAL
jgi:protein SCO1/2